MVAALLAITAPSAVASPVTSMSDARHGEDHKGPIGWDTYRQLDRISAVTTGVETKQFSSFDRTGGNEDGFGGVYSCLRMDNGCVIAEHSGAGELASIWFTRDEGDVTRTGNIKVELDGQTVLDKPLQDVVNGMKGTPFVYPFVANADQSSGGVFIKVPMTFRSRMKITTQNNPLFYHVTYRTFSGADGVTTFNPNDVPTTLIADAQRWGQQDPKKVTPSSTQKKSFSLAPGQKTTLAEAKGSGEVTELKLQVPQLTAPPALPYISDDGRATKDYTQFTVKVDPANQGVKLTRRFDANSNHQVADIFVDGTKVGQWPATNDTPGTWSYQTVTLPASATAGKSSITVRNQFVSASIDWNEFHYWVDSIVGGKDVRTDELDVGASAAGLASEKAHAYVISNQTWQGTPRQTDKPSNPNDPAVLASNELLRNVYVRATFDGNTTVESPLGEFFSSGLQEASVASMFLRVDPATDTLTSWWPMPYAKTATLELVNRSASQTISSATSSVSVAADKTYGPDLRKPDPTLGYFYASHHRGDPVNGQDWLFLQTAGVGRFVGVSQTVHGQIPSGNLREYLEGDERVYVDGSQSPSIHGTGTEDFYESGWYFNRGPFSNPTNGLSAMPTQSYGCQYQCDAPYRLMIGDAVPFRSGITFGIEHGPVDNAPAEYSSTAYWYGFADQAGSHVSDTIDLGDAASRKQHAYSGAPADQPLTATYEGDHDDQAVSDTVSSSTAAQTFTVMLDPTNTAVTLRRTSDQAKAYQSADVKIDGKPAGTWLQPLGNASHRWLDDTFQIDPGLTAHKRSVTVTITPTAGAPAWTATGYTVLDSRRLSNDNKDPSAVTGLEAVGTSSNAIQLSWNPATDNVGVDHYEVYGAKGRSVTPSQATLVGTSTLPVFTHSGIGLKETWTYVVRAVDTAENTGRFSSPASATSGDTLRLEGESLLPPVRSTDPAVAQGNCCGVSWSNGQQLWFQGGHPGTSVTLNFAVPQTGSYAATAALTGAADYGIVQVSIDGQPVGPAIDKYQPTGVGVADAALGTVALTGGQHTLTLTVTGKNAAAVNYFAGLDVLSLKLAT